MKQFFVYTLRDPRDNTVRYVGCSANPQRRYMQHIAPSRLRVESKGARGAWIVGLLAADECPEMEIIATCNEDDRLATEQAWITQLLQDGEPLTNTQFNASIATPRRSYTHSKWHELFALQPTK